MIKFLKQKNKAFVPYETKGFRSGFTLVETLIAVSIFTVSLLGIMSVLASSISNTTYTKQKMVATYLAQEGVEYVRNMRDTYIFYTSNGDWNGFTGKLSSCGVGSECGLNTSLFSNLADANLIKKCVDSPNICKVYLNNGSYNTNSTGTDSGFTRKIWMTKADGLPFINSVNEVKIYSRVDWTQGSGKYNMTFSENLFNWVE